MHQSKVDNELCFRHDASGKLVCIMTIHVDDLKIAGEHWVVQELLKILEQEFGELTIERGTFTNCGVQHIQNPITKENDITMLVFDNRVLQRTAPTGNMMRNMDMKEYYEVIQQMENN